MTKCDFCPCCIFIKKNLIALSIEMKTPYEAIKQLQFI